MQIKEVTKYEVGGYVFNTRKEAEDYSACHKITSDLTTIIDTFYYDGIDLSDIVDGVLENSNLLCKVLKEYKQC